ncbi:MAG: heme ABC transporter permease [Gammaproteobacteria bacterium]|nr:heme ABC transporter permease [Gammaproteobacteria bacterium]
MIKKFIHQFASPKTYLFQVNRAYKYIFYISLCIYLFSLTWGILFTPEDFVQGNSYRIIYLHVPASFLSQSLYAMMAIASIIFLVWRVKLAAYLIIAIAPIGAVTTFIALFSGSIWGIPTWGTWWQWDARITSTLILFIMYLGLIALHSSFSNSEKADKLLSWLVIVGFVNIPIIKKSVDWWSTLHQSASITLTEKPSIDPIMLYPLIGSIIGFFGLIICLIILSSKYQIIKRERKKSWIKDYV